MGKVLATRADGSVLEVRTSAKTKHVRLGHEQPARVDLSGLGPTPALTEMTLSGDRLLEALDLSPLESHAALGWLTARVASAIDLAPLATTPLQSLTLHVGGAQTLDFTPLAGHPGLAHVALTYCGTQASLDLSFVRTLPALRTLHVAGGDWRELDLSPLRGLALTSVTLTHQYLTDVDLDVIAQPALEHLLLQELEIAKAYWDLAPLGRCPRLTHLSLLGAEIGTLELTAIAGLTSLRRFDAPNVKAMMVQEGKAILAPGLAAWRANIGHP